MELSAFRFPVPVTLDLNVGIDYKVLLFTFLLSLATGVLFGLLPAWTAAWRFPSTALKGEDVLARPGRFWTLRNLLVVAQMLHVSRSSLPHRSLPPQSSQRLQH